MQGLFAQYILSKGKKVVARNTHQVKNAMLCECCFRKSLFVSGLCGRPRERNVLPKLFLFTRLFRRSCFIRRKSQTGRRAVGVSPTAARNFINFYLLIGIEICWCIIFHLSSIFNKQNVALTQSFFGLTPHFIRPWANATVSLVVISNS